ncbi:MAG: hypothetical protein AUI36_44660 [Cyanobacteria bacterium 13_1_40CM_2_61_4]|nr:MAG: hypothetical protein AUI36_44660 [Cyanobacteria bacterium 13_1_40CM_2_61_4]
MGADRPESGGLLAPLKQILDATDLIRSSPQHLQTQEVIGLVDDVHQHACRLQRTIENCFYYAQIGLLESDWEKIESARQQVAVVQDVIEPLAREKARQERRANDLILEFTDATVGMSADCLEKIVEELLDNAFRFSQSGSPVWLTAESTPDGTALSVRDCGRGMAPKQIAELESSLPLERMLTERHGCGLGLTVVRRLVELHQGGFGIRSELEKGTEVVVQLPAPTRGSEDAITDSADWGSLTGDRGTEQALCPAIA